MASHTDPYREGSSRSVGPRVGEHLNGRLQAGTPKWDRDTDLRQRQRPEFPITDSYRAILNSQTINYSCKIGEKSAAEVISGGHYMDGHYIRHNKYIIIIIVHSNSTSSEKSRLYLFHLLLNTPFAHILPYLDYEKRSIL